MITRKNRQTGTPITIATAEALCVDDAGGKWITVCDQHGYLINHDTKTLAMSHAASPIDWCQGCQAMTDEGLAFKTFTVRIQSEKELQGYTQTTQQKPWIITQNNERRILARFETLHEAIDAAYWSDTIDELRSSQTH